MTRKDKSVFTKEAPRMESMTCSECKTSNPTNRAHCKACGSPLIDRTFYTTHLEKFPKQDTIIAVIGALSFYGFVFILYFSRIGFAGGLLGLLLMLLWGIAFLVFLIRGIFRRSFYGVHAFLPTFVLSLPLFILIPCDGGSCIQSGLRWLDFTYYRQNREEVIHLIRTGRLTPEDPELPFVIHVPKHYGNVSGNENRVTFDRGPGETISVAFYLSDREFDIYVRSFYYTDSPSEIATYERLIREGRTSYTFRVVKYADHWYTSGAKHGYTKY